MDRLSSQLDYTLICCRNRASGRSAGNTHQMLTGNYTVMYWQVRIRLHEPWPLKTNMAGRLTWGKWSDWQIQFEIWFIDSVSLGSLFLCQMLTQKYMSSVWVLRQVGIISLQPGTLVSDNCRQCKKRKKKNKKFVFSLQLCNWWSWITVMLLYISNWMFIFAFIFFTWLCDL